jgi:hypothetical protein
MKKQIKKEKNVFFKEAFEYFDRYYNECCSLDNKIDEKIHEKVATNILRDQMLNELSNLKTIIEYNQDIKIKFLSKEKKELFNHFIKFYQVCPICHQYNHFYNLKRLFFDEDKKEMKNELIKFMELNKKKLRKYKLSFGIPCCNCYKNFFKK